MFRYHDSRHIPRVAFALGFAAFAVNASVVSAQPQYALMMGDILLFLVAMALGPAAAIVALGAALTPEVLFIDDQGGHAPRVFLLVTAVGLCARKIPSLPSFIVVMLGWLLVILPCSILSPVFVSRMGFWDPRAVVFHYFTDVMVTLVAGAILLNPTLWCLVTRLPHRLRYTPLLVHTLALTTAFTVFAAIATLHRMGLVTDDMLTSRNLVVAIGLFSTLVIAASGIGARLSFIAMNSFEEVIHSSLNPRSSGGVAWSEVSWLPKVEASLEAANQNPLAERAARGRTGFAEIDSSFTVLEIDEGFRDLLGVQPHFVSGQSVSQLGSSPVMVRELLDLLQTLQDSPQLVHEVRVPTESGQQRFFELERRLVAHRNDGRSVAGRRFRLIVRDVTDRRTVEARLLEAGHSASLSRFVKTLAKNVNDALTSIIARASFALHVNEPSEQLAALKEIVTGAHRAGDATRRILEFAHGTKIQVAPRPVSRLIEDSLQLIRESLNNCEIRMTVQGGTPTVRVDPNLFAEAITNVLLNARESYEDLAGPIWIDVGTEEIDRTSILLQPGARPGMYVRIRVNDKGCGMAQDLVAHAFDPMLTTKRDSGHVGLGLSMVFAIVRAADGFLTVESRTGNGTAVSMYLPLANQHLITDAGGSADAEIAAEPEKRTAVRETRILVVEEADELREVVMKMLSSLGYQVMGCRSTSEAIPLAHTNPCSVVLFDGELCGSPDQQDFAKLRADSTAEKAVWLCNAWEMEQLKERFANDLFVTKPFRMDELAATVREAIEGKPPEPPVIEAAGSPV